MSLPNREAELAEAKKQYEKELEYARDSLENFPTFEEWLEEINN